MKIGKAVQRLKVGEGRRGGGALMSDLLVLDASTVFLRSAHSVDLVYDEGRKRMRSGDEWKGNSRSKTKTETVLGLYDSSQCHIIH